MLDRYTKVVLTVIAVALVYIAVKGSHIIVPAVAQSNQPMHVVIDGFGYNAFRNAGPLQIIQR